MIVGGASARAVRKDRSAGGRQWLSLPVAVSSAHIVMDAATVRSACLLIFYSILLCAPVLTCPSQCNCVLPRTVSCHGQNLTVVPPDIPPDTQRLELHENKIGSITRNDFSNLRQLKVLQLTDNELSVIEDNAFDNLEALEKIKLNRNKLRQIPDHLFRNCRRLHRIDLSENLLTSVTDEQLRGPKSVRSLQLEKNQLTCVDARTISQWTEMEILSMHGNSLNTLSELDFMPDLRILRLNDNPWICDCRLKWMKKTFNGNWLTNAKCHRPALVQGQTLANVNEQYMKCSGIEKRAAGTCVEASSCPSVCSCTESTVDCRDRGLKHIPQNLPPSTTELRLEQNLISTVPPNAFKTLKNLRRLDLSKNRISEISPNAFDHLEKLNTLVLYGNNLTDIPAKAFSSLSSLQLLFLNANKLQCLRRGLFDSLVNLNLLSLYDNEIKSISNATFSPLRNLQTLHLARNPLVCDCNLEWLSELLSVRAIETSGARCEAPKRVRNRKLSQLHQSKFRCKGSEAFVTQNADECIVDYSCPALCHCHLTSVDCSGRGMRDIPHDIPIFATELVLSRNNITTVRSASSLQRLKNLRILTSCPVLQNCKHEQMWASIEESSFVVPRHLCLYIIVVYSDLSNNHISSIEDKAFQGLPLLSELNLSSNDIRHFSHTHFGTAVTNLEVLNLDHNSVQCVTSETFSYFTSLRTLSLSHNQIRTITNGALSTMTQLTQLHLEENQLVCNCYLADFVRHVSKNAQILHGETVCREPSALSGVPLSKVKSQDLSCHDNSGNVCTENGSYCPFGCSCVDGIVRCSNRNLTDFPSGIATDTTELYLNSNAIKTIPIEQLSRLTKLTKLDLSHNLLEVVENSTFARLPKLSTLIISYNHLQCLEPAAFQGLNNLRILSLHANELSSLPESAFGDLTNITHIALGSNSLYCDCNMAWFSKWIKTRFVEPGISRCELPIEMKNQLLLTASQRQFSCNNVVPMNILAKCDACLKYPCRNKGVCESLPGLQYKCRCPAGYHGHKCEHEIDACYGDPCLNNATCSVQEHGRFVCQCRKGFKGDRCETNVDDCANHKCANGATCIDQVNSYSCLCPPMYTGEYCGEKIELCSKNFNPCQNGGKCSLSGTNNYVCHCAKGFSGANCTENIDDCANHMCMNSGICVDGVNSYSCKCLFGYTGKFCEIPPISNRLYPNTATCQSGLCDHGYCRPIRNNEFVCQCYYGYSGERCNKLRSVGFRNTLSYVGLEPWNADPFGNLTFTLTTSNSTGIIVYYGDKSYLSAELYDGRIKIGFYVGNNPASFMYSYALVNDGVPHKVELIVKGRQVSMSLDGSNAQTIVNYGKIQSFELGSKQNIYFGGIPERYVANAMSNFHVRQKASLQGCISDLNINGKAIDFYEDIVEKKDMIAGCDSVVNLCQGVDCGGHGTCHVNNTFTDGFHCKCDAGFNGKHCDKREIRCVKERYRKVHHEGECRSVEAIKNARCMGWCGENESVKSSPQSCCSAVRTKKRRVKMHCKDGSTKAAVVNIIRRCQCANSCDRSR
uniref:Slit homolog 2 protein-like n=1 Tax=Steinernema glaseri TaxID=37863 RepID=A0A1I7YNA8_9BILA